MTAISQTAYLLSKGSQGCSVVVVFQDIKIGTFIYLSLMVCSHCPTSRLIKRPIKNGLYTEQRQTSTQIPIGFCANLSLSVSVSVPGRLRVNAS